MGKKKSPHKLPNQEKNPELYLLLKKEGQGLQDKIAVAVKALSSITYTQDVKSSLFPATAGPLRLARYFMTIWETLSVKKLWLERQSEIIMKDFESNWQGQ